jgi:hypothetical protein
MKGIALLATIAAVGCDLPFGAGDKVCTLEARPGLRVNVMDFLTGAGPAQATVIAIDGAFADTLHTIGSPPLIFGGLFERAGTYTIVVKSAGYVDWTKAGVVVTADECHVRLTEVTARLVRS